MSLNHGCKCIHDKVHDECKNIFRTVNVTPFGTNGTLSIREECMTTRCINKRFVFLENKVKVLMGTDAERRGKIVKGLRWLDEDVFMNLSIMNNKDAAILRTV